jgi:hypothetical protein
LNSLLLLLIYPKPARLAEPTPTLTTIISDFDKLGSLMPTILLYKVCTVFVLISDLIELCGGVIGGINRFLGPSFKELTRGVELKGYCLVLR